ncbi:hypothetical protein Q9966_014086 [Columba livia]|nr:hypothetical protein Q9966_014086 [Columba livia]
MLSTERLNFASATKPDGRRETIPLKHRAALLERIKPEAENPEQKWRITESVKCLFGVGKAYGQCLSLCKASKRMALIWQIHASLFSSLEILDSELEAILGYMLLETWRISGINRSTLDSILVRTRSLTSEDDGIALGLCRCRHCDSVGNGYAYFGIGFDLNLDLVRFAC